MNKSSAIVCTNCHKPGHLQYHCRHPITSYGIIAVKLTPTPQYLMIRRRNTFGFIGFMCGKYLPNNLEQIQGMVDEMTCAEKADLLSKSFGDLWHNMWEDTKNYPSEEMPAQKKFDIVRNTTLPAIIAGSQTAWHETEWEFPKGRKNYHERDIECASREFSEETGYPASILDVVENILPFDEIYIGTDNRSYKHRYYLAFVSDESLAKHIPQFQSSEVSGLEWRSAADCATVIRPYNLEKLAMIEKIDRVIATYAFSS